jgi:hypothetical protein
VPLLIGQTGYPLVGWIDRTTSTSAVRPISVRTSGRGESTWFFDFGTGRAHLSDLGGSSLALYLVQCNPNIDCPPRLLRWAPPL